MFYTFNYQEVNKDYQNTRPHCNVSIAGNIINALADTGAQATAMSAQKFAMIFGKTKFDEIKIPTGKSFRGAGGNLLPLVGCYNIPIIVNRREFYTPVYIFEHLATDLILGSKFMEKARFLIDMGNRKIVMDNEVISCNFDEHQDQIDVIRSSQGSLTEKVDIPGHTLKVVEITGDGTPNQEFFTLDYFANRPDLMVYHTVTKSNEKGNMMLMIGNVSTDRIILNKGSKLAEVRQTTKEFKIPKLEPERLCALKENQKPKKMSTLEEEKFVKKLNIECPREYRPKYIKLCLSYHDCFSKHEYDLGWTDKVSHRITLTHNEPIYTKQYKIALQHRETVEQFVHDMLDKKLIEVSRSRYNSPIIVVKKKDGTWRPCVDLRGINKATVEDQFSLRDIQSCIDEIGRNRSKIFLFNGHV